MSETPRTDIVCGDSISASACLARTLERELTAAQREIERLKADLEAATAGLDGMKDILAGVNCERDRLLAILERLREENRVFEMMDGRDQQSIDAALAGAGETKKENNQHEHEEQ